ncbi:BMP family ABC transporter substrate-binding protein [Spirochaetia bacterium]|nr:BMP family ABC transporter substrate-binding protein [Spirochaetia bacterium]
MEAVIKKMLVLAAIAGLLFSGCTKKEVQWKPGMPMDKEKLKVGVIHVSNPLEENSGYAYAHEQGIVMMRRELGLGEDQIIRKINIDDADQAQAESAMRDCIAAGAQVIIATSWGFMETCEKLAAEFPTVIFAHASGYKSNGSNFTNYFGRIYQARYLSGIAAGLKTRTNKIGYVAAMGKDSSEVSGGINAFALGVEKVNPDARIFVRVTYSWFDPMEEMNAARSLIAAGCDVIAQHCDTSNPQVEAAASRVWGIGYNTDMGLDAPEAVITSVLWNWGIYYTALVRSLLDGSFSAEPYLGGLSDGMVDISPLSAIAAPGTEEIIMAERERMVTGIFDVFEGVLETNDIPRRRIGEAGKRLADSEILGGINWYYRTVVEP